MQLAARTFVVPLLTGLMLSVSMPATQARASCSGATAVPSPANVSQIERSTLCLLNVQRRAHGLGRLRSNHLLRLAALRHSRDMVTNSYFAHNGRDGSSFLARIRRTGYLLRTRYWRAGENLAWAVGTNVAPRAVVRAWMKSPPHRRNILTPDFQSVGLGVIPGSPRFQDRGATYTTDFGSRTR
jgi:uncharacterized protein YkwD